MLDCRNLLIGGLRVENQQFGTFDADICGRVNQPYAVHRRSGPLVKLPRKILHGKIFRV